MTGKFRIVGEFSAETINRLHLMRIKLGLKNYDEVIERAVRELAQANDIDQKA